MATLSKSNVITGITSQQLAAESSKAEMKKQKLETERCDIN